MRNRSLLIGVALFFLVGCGGVDLHHDLTEVEADEILVLLLNNGIDAKKVKEVSGQDVSWKLTVPSADAGEARKILVENNLPNKRELGLSGVYKEKGLIPTPDEQKARFLLALKGEIINSLKKIPGVVDADIVLNIPTEDKFSLVDEKRQKPTASVIIRGRSGGDYSLLTEDKIQQFVANAVPSLHPQDISVIMTQIQKDGQEAGPSWLPGSAEPPSELKTIAGLKMDPDSSKKFRFYTLIALAVLMLMSVALIVNVVRLNRLRQKKPLDNKVKAIQAKAERAGMLQGGGEPAP